MMKTLEQNSQAVGSSAYWGDRGNWLIAAAVHRDSDCLARSNFECMRDALKELPSFKEWNDAARYAQQEQAGRFERMKHRHENGTAPRAVTAYQLFQTPPAIAAQLVVLAEINRNCRVLEPSAGLGRILDAIQPHAWDVTAIEIAPNLCGELYRQERPEVKILQRDFLTVTPGETGLFDAVIMNPPFHLRSDIAHIRHALQFVKAGGKLVSVCMDTHHRREAFAHLGQWIELPAGSFKESNTPTPTAIIVMQK